MYIVDLKDHVGSFPQVELPYEEGSVDIRDYRISSVDLGDDLEIRLVSDSGRIILRFIEARLLEEGGTSAEAAASTWLMSISRPDAWDIRTREDILAFCLDYAVVEGWVVQCREAQAIIQPRI
jgi:hypothetical protein